MGFTIMNNKNKGGLLLKLDLLDNIEFLLKKLKEYAKKDNYKNIVQGIDGINLLIKTYYPKNEYEANMMLQKLMFLVNDLYYQEKGLIDYIKWNKVEKEKNEQNEINNIEKELYINMMKIVDVIVK